MTQSHQHFPSCYACNFVIGVQLQHAFNANIFSVSLTSCNIQFTYTYGELVFSNNYIMCIHVCWGRIIMKVQTIDFVSEK